MNFICRKRYKKFRNPIAALQTLTHPFRRKSTQLFLSECKHESVTYDNELTFSHIFGKRKTHLKQRKNQFVSIKKKLYEAN